MNNRKLFYALLLSSSILYAGKNVSPAVAEVVPIPMVQPTPIYVGLGIVYGKYSGCPSSGCRYEDVTYGAMLRVGYEFNQYLGAEVRAVDTFLGADPLGGEKLMHAGIFAKPQYPLSEDFNAYGLLGYGWAKTTTELSGSLLPILNKSGFSVGFGFEYDLSGKSGDFRADTFYDRSFDGQADEETGWGIFVDYQRLIVGSNLPSLDVVSIGITYDF